METQHNMGIGRNMELIERVAVVETEQKNTKDTISQLKIDIKEKNKYINERFDKLESKLDKIAETLSFNKEEIKNQISQITLGNLFKNASFGIKIGFWGAVILFGIIPNIPPPVKTFLEEFFKF